ncbi:MAG: rhodanese-like domain-containing protein [Mariprofundales bacterium]
MKEVQVQALYPKWLRSRERGTPCAIIDVREVEEYVQGHVPGAQLVVLNTIASHSEAFAKDGEVYVICRSGMRSSQAIKYLRQQHKHDNLINVAGGTVAWMKENYPIEQGEK